MFFTLFNLFEGSENEPDELRSDVPRQPSSGQRKRFAYGDVVFADGRYWHVVLDAGTHLQVVRRLVRPAPITHIRTDEVEAVSESERQHAERTLT